MEYFLIWFELFILHVWLGMVCSLAYAFLKSNRNKIYISISLCIHEST